MSIHFLHSVGKIVIGSWVHRCRIVVRYRLPAGGLTIFFGMP